MPPPPPPPKGEKLMAPPKPTTGIAAPARIVVSLPADAKLFVDGNATQTTQATRVFASPEPGKEYYYAFTGEIVRGDQTLRSSKTVTIRAGQEVDVQLDFPATTLAQR